MGNNIIKEFSDGVYVILIKINLLFIIAFYTTSCTTVNLTARAGKDIQLNSSDFDKFNGTYLNIPTDSNYQGRTLYCNFTKGNKDTLCRQSHYTVKVESSDSKTLNFNLDDNGITIESLTLKGRYKKGYFKVNRQNLFDCVVGPLVWVLGEHINYIGLSKSNNLVVLDSGGVGVLFIIAFPIFVAGGDKHDYEYTRTK